MASSSSPDRPAASGRQKETQVLEVSGRWARLSDGRLVTPVPSFKDFGFDYRRFNAAIDRFQADPAGVINRDGIEDETRGR